MRGGAGVGLGLRPNHYPFFRPFCLLRQPSLHAPRGIPCQFISKPTRPTVHHGAIRPISFSDVLYDSSWPRTIPNFQQHRVLAEGMRAVFMRDGT